MPSTLTVGTGKTYATVELAMIDAIAGDTISIESTWSGDDATQVNYDVAAIIIVDASSKQIGRPFQSGDTHYRHRVTSGHAFVVTADVDITDVDIQSDSSTTSDEIFRAAANYNATITNCMLGFTGNVDQQDVWYCEDNGTKTVTFEQCFFYDVGRSIVDQTAGSSGTFTVNFNSCGSFNIAANGGRNAGMWFGSLAGASATIVVNAHNCLLHHASGISDRTVACASGATVTAHFNYCIGNNPTTDLFSDVDTTDTVGTVGSYTWTAAADPGTGDFVGLVNITSGTYNPALTDHANNDAKGFHAVVTDAGLTIPDLDILGQTRDKTTPLFDVGPSALTLAAGGPPSTSPHHLHLPLLGVG